MISRSADLSTFTMGPVTKLVLLSLFSQIFCRNLCYRPGGIACCSGYKWDNLNKRCDKCPPGFTESECTQKCIFPSYGQGCGMICECREDLCDFMVGCNVNGKAVNNSSLILSNQDYERLQILTTGHTTMNTNTESHFDKLIDIRSALNPRKLFV
ncbi:uncharacterized protein LOC144621850 [Crassostrea virginica]